MSSPLRLERGSIFAGDFKVVRPLRTGGQGSLYVVEQISTSKHRALKLMLPELVAQPAARRRFELEARVAARIQSDHVVESIGSGVDAKTGVPWLAMELLEGEDLAAQLQKRRRLPPGEVLEVFDQLCHALGEAHRQGIVHRDLKPENIFLATPRRRGVPFVVKVLDFGIARVVAESQTQSGQTTTGLGTPMWMAPEQTMPGGPVAPSTDVWPLGLLAFRMLTGYLFWKTPYEPGGSVMMLMAEAFMHPMPSATERAAHYKCPERVPPGFDAWFSKCMSRAMDERYANAADAFAALAPVLAPYAEPSPASRASIDMSPPVEPIARISVELPAVTPHQRTGPGLATWGGAPELSDSAMLSDLEIAAAAASPSTGPRAPVSAGGTPAPPAPAAAAAATQSGPVVLAPIAPTPEPRAVTSSTPEPRAATPSTPEPRAVTPSTPEPRVVTGSAPALGGITAEQVPPVTKAAPAPSPPAPAKLLSSLPPPRRSKAPLVVGAAVAVGVLLGVLLFALGGKDGPAPAAPSTASAQAVTDRPPPPATAAPPEPPPLPATATSTGAPEPSSSASAGAVESSSPASPGRKGAPLCKPAGAKCFGNDECCDRTCRKWTCRANADLEDPYKPDKL